VDQAEEAIKVMAMVQGAMEQALAGAKEEKKRRDRLQFLMQRAGRLIDRGCWHTTTEEYAEWLWQHLALGGLLDGVCAYEMKQEKFVTAAQGTHIPESYGKNSLRVLIPKDTNWTRDLDLGDTIIYETRNYLSHRGPASSRAAVLLFSDTEELMRKWAKERSAAPEEEGE